MNQKQRQKLQSPQNPLQQALRRCFCWEPEQRRPSSWAWCWRCPVELSGRLETADQRPLPDAVVALTQDGALVAQTTTNAEGAFGFKVRRGTYELTFFAPDESGQSVQTTVKVKAPLSGVTLTAERPCSGAV